MQINKVVNNLQYSLIRTLKEEAINYSNVIDLTVGEPDLETPKEIINETFKIAKNSKLKYPPTGGGEKIRSLIAEHYNEKYNTSYKPDNVIVNVGASEAISSCFRTILNPNDEVIVLSPFYAGYPPMIELCYAKPIYIDISKHNFILTPEILEQYLTNKTKAILFCNPCNPTGNVMNYEEMKNLANFLAGKDLFIISDEIYSELSFEKFYSFGYFENLRDQLIIINGFSKSHSMTGWRIGYTLFPLKYRKYLLNTTLYTLSSPMAVSIMAGEVALEKFDNRNDFRNIYKERALYLYRELKKIGFDPVMPKGAFYIFVNYSKISNLSSYDFAIDLLKKSKIALVPGIAFGVENYFRISAIYDISILEKVITRLKSYIKENQK